jgi:ParB-like chromosome segregation protein Spo0J
VNIRDRIKELRRVPAGDLRPNPKNWRTHPKEQADALRGTLAEIGFAGAVLARELPDGTLELIDGHLRAETAGDAAVPVLVLDVTEAEADKLLATLDPLAAMATVDAGKLEELLATVETDSEALRAMMDGLASEAGITSPEFSPATLDEQSRLDEKAKIQCPECGHEFTT